MRRLPAHIPDPLAAARATVAAHLDVLRALLLDRDGVASLAAELGSLAIRARPDGTDAPGRDPGRLHIPSPAGAIALALRELPGALAIVVGDHDAIGTCIAVTRACGLTAHDVNAATETHRGAHEHVTTWSLGQQAPT